jgi:hypothetical protein
MDFIINNKLRIQTTELRVANPAHYRGASCPVQFYLMISTPHPSLHTHWLKRANEFYICCVCRDCFQVRLFMLMSYYYVHIDLFEDRLLRPALLADRYLRHIIDEANNFWARSYPLGAPVGFARFIHQYPMDQQRSAGLPLI